MYPGFDIYLAHLMEKLSIEEGKKYLVTEWDDEVGVVIVERVSLDDDVVWIEYEDGTRQSLSLAYFVTEMKPTPLSQLN